MPSRNEPCPCGSGKKYKHCHLGDSLAVADVHAMDHELIELIGTHAVKKKVGGFSVPPLPETFLAPFVAYQAKTLEGATMAELFVRDRGWTLSERQRGWIAAQADAITTIMEVTDVEPGLLSTRDLFTDTPRRFREVAGSRSIHRGLGIISRVTTFEGEVHLTGIHDQPLPRAEFESLAYTARRELKITKTSAATKLRMPEIALQLMVGWDEDAEHLRGRPFPQLQNRSGDPILLTTDTFTFEPKNIKVLTRGITEFAGAYDESGTTYMLFVSEADETIVAMVFFGDGLLTVDANSVERADAVRATLESRFGKVIRHRSRSHVDPRSEALEHGEVEEVEQTADEIEMVLQMKRQHYSTWTDEPLPALNGKTPRQAVRTPYGKELVRDLLLDMSEMERRFDPATQFDFTPVLRELDLLPRIDFAKRQTVIGSFVGTPQEPAWIVFEIPSNVGPVAIRLLSTPPGDPDRSVDVSLPEFEAGDEFDALLSVEFSEEKKLLVVRSERRHIELDLSRMKKTPVAAMLRMLRKMKKDAGFEVTGV